MRKLTLITIITIFTMGLALFATEQGTTYDELQERLRPQIKKMMKKNKITGLSLALVDGDETIWVEGFGYADLKKRIPADEESVYKLASISKLFTGIAIMQLVEQGKIDLDSPLTDYIPEFSINSRFENARPFTIRDMLTHQSGLPALIFMPVDMPLTEEAVRLHNSYEQRLLEIMANSHLAYPPGYISSYSNPAYDLLGVVVERVSGLSFVDYTNSNIISPLNMDASFTPLYLRDGLGERAAEGYYNNRPLGKKIFTSIGSGTLNSDVGSMSSFLKMLLARGSYNGQQLLSTESLNKMWTRQNEDLTLDMGKEMGLSFFMNDDKLAYAGSTYGHSGGLTGFQSQLLILPDHDLGVIVVCNSNSISPVAYNLTVKLLQEALIIKKITAPSPPESAPKDVVMTREQALSYEGLYATRFLGAIKLRALGKRLYVHSLGVGVRFEVRMQESGYFRAVTPIPILQSGYYQFIEHNGQKLIYFGDKPTSPIGAEYRPVELTPFQQERLGEYRVVMDKDTIPAHSRAKFSLSYKRGILALNVPALGQLPLVPLNNEECLVAGIGSGAGDSVYFTEEEGRFIIRWGGYILEKVK